MTDQELEQVANSLYAVIRPYYKTLRPSAGRPEFRRSLRAEQIEEILQGVHEQIVLLKQKSRQSTSIVA